MKKVILFAIAISVMAVLKTNAQSSSGNNNFAAGKYLGYVAGLPGNLDFHTANAGGAPLMRLQNSNGFLGIGLIAPAWHLDVQDDISIKPNGTGQAYYRIFGSPVLHVFGSFNTCVGENNGLSLGVGSLNTFAGNSAGASNTSGSQNVFIGTSAGASNVGNNDNTFVGTYAGQVNTANGNTFIGSSAGTNNTGGVRNVFAGNAAGSTNVSGDDNTFMGFQAGLVSTAIRNTFVGSNAGVATTIGFQNTFIGNNAGAANIGGAGFQGSLNTFVGDDAGLVNTIGFGNAFFGDQSGIQNTDGENNTFLGHHAGGNNTTGDFNCYIGSHAAFQNVASQGNRNNYLGAQSGPAEIAGDDNQFIGWQAGFSNTSGDRNVLIGSQTGLNLTTSDNVFIGHNSALLQVTGTNNTYVGTNSGNNGSILNLSNAAAIGANSVARNNNHMILGDNNVNVGIGLSNDPTGPRDKLEIKGVTGTSGLQFTQINAGTTPTANPGPGVLALDANGKVIYVPDVASAGAIQTCGTNQPIANDLEIDMGSTSNQSFIFRDYSVNATSKVGIGLNSCAPAAKLHVYQQSGQTNTIGTLLENADQANAGNAIALQVKESALFSGLAGDIRIAGWFEVDPTGICSTPKYALHVPQCGGYISFGYPVPTITFGSLLNVNGNITALGTVYPSDRRYKTNITPINKDTAIAKVRALKGVYYNWDMVGYPDHNFDSIRQLGFIAQDVAAILPEAVRLDNNGFYGVEYTKFIPLLTNAIQELDSLNTAKDSIINSMNDRLAQLESIVNGCCNLNGGMGARMEKPGNNNLNQKEVELTNNSTIILNQNVPNPFAEKTVITYSIPEQVKTAQLLFYDARGVVLKTVDITERGNGMITVYSSNLSSGTYSYSLLVDGRVTDTKRMVCIK